MTLQQAMITVGAKIPLSDDTVKARFNRAYDIVRQNGSGYLLTKSVDMRSYHCLLCGEYAQIKGDYMYCVNHPKEQLVSAVRYKWHIYKASTAPAFSSEDSSAFYTIDKDGCSCPDAPKARAGLCKHKLATILMIEMEKE